MVRLRYRKPVVVITAENLNDPMVNMDFKERFRNHDHPIDLVSAADMSADTVLLTAADPRCLTGTFA